MAEERTIHSVTDLNRTARLLLEQGMSSLWVEGEISRLTCHASGHWYFTLKDAGAAVSCAMFKQNNQAVGFTPKDGQKVVVLGGASLYEARGNYQLIIREMEQAGKGSLQQQFEELKAKLDKEGLFDQSRKQPIPMLPKKIGIITSPTGAAVRDIIQVITRRYPNVEILLAPVTVQGAQAAPRIAKALRFLNSRDDIDTIICGRGGGSLEDLWAFNEEEVARAIAESKIPVISAVGHEIDFTIADFVADLRAPTPSAAAELAVPVYEELEEQIRRLSIRLSSSLRSRTQLLTERIPGLERRITQSLQSGLQQRQQRLDEASMILTHELKRAVSRQRERPQALQRALTQAINSRLDHKRQSLASASQRLTVGTQNAVHSQKQNLQRIQAQLRALSPHGVIDRGYSLTELSDGTLVRDPKNVAPGTIIKTRLTNGTLTSEVK